MVFGSGRTLRKVHKKVRTHTIWYMVPLGGGIWPALDCLVAIIRATRKKGKAKAKRKQEARESRQFGRKVRTNEMFVEWLSSPFQSFSSSFQRSESNRPRQLPSRSRRFMGQEKMVLCHYTLGKGERVIFAHIDSQKYIGNPL